MAKKKVQLEVSQVYQQEAERLLSDRKRSKIIHGTKDIRASGDEFEVPGREFLTRRLPRKYHVGHGHVVDTTLTNSPQVDVIIADNSATPILLEGKNGTQYIPYESVYMIGEIKSTYEKRKSPIKAFSRTVAKVKTSLHRDETPPNYVGNGLVAGPGLSTDCDVPYRNPLFSFMLFGDSGDLDTAALTQEYADCDDPHLPNIVCFLDGRVAAKATLVAAANGKYGFGVFETDCHRRLTQEDCHWILLDFTSPETKHGEALGVLMLAIFDHLRTCVLLSPPVGEYLQHVTQGARYEVKAIDRDLLDSKKS